MKKRNPFVTVFLLILLTSAACHYHRYRTKTVKVENGHHSLKIEYCGDVYFNETETAIEEMAPDGYIKYKKDDNRFLVECNKSGEISYRLSSEGIRLNANADGAKEFIARVVKEIAYHYDR